MATRSTIIVEMGPSDPGKWGMVNVHRLGEPECRASLLLDHYSGVEKVRGLIALGDLSSIDREITCPPGHSFDAPVDGHSVAYGRDRGEEEDVEARYYPSLAAALQMATEEFVYVHRDGQWWWAFTDDGAVPIERLRPLTRDSTQDDGGSRGA